MTVAIETLSAADADTIASALINQNTGHLARFLPAKPPKVSFHGDSIANFMGQLEANSALFWQQAYAPRNYRIVRDGRLGTYDQGSGFAVSGEMGGNFAVSSTLSGQIWTGIGRTGSQLHATGTGDLTDATRLARVTAYAPDIMIIETSTNENLVAYTTAAGDATILNVKELIAANPNPNKQVVLVSPLPRNGPIYSHVANYIQWAQHKDATYPGYHYLDLASYIVDDTQATNWSWVSGYSPDNLHPGLTMGRLVWSEWDNLWTKLGVRKLAPRPGYQQDVWSTSNPGGNLLGSRGVCAGTLANVVRAGHAGQLPPGWTATNGSGDTTNVTITWSRTTMTDSRGVVHTAVLGTLSNTGTPLTSTTTLQITVTPPTAPTSYVGYELYSQAIIQHANLVGLNGITMYAGGDQTSQTLNTQSTMGASVSGNVLPTLVSAETLYYLNPWRVILSGSPNTTPLQRFEFNFSAGALPAGTILVGNAGMWLDYPSTYD
jgi:hypothetical protein